MGAAISSSPGRVDVFQQGWAAGGCTLSCKRPHFIADASQMDPRLQPYVAPDDYQQSLERANQVLARRTPTLGRFLCSLFLSLFFFGSLFAVLTLVPIANGREHCMAEHGACVGKMTPQSDECCSFYCCAAEHGHATACKDMEKPLEEFAKHLPKPVAEWSCAELAGNFGKGVVGAGCPADVIRRSPKCNYHCQAALARDSTFVSARCPVTCGACPINASTRALASLGVDAFEVAALRGGFAPKEVELQSCRPIAPTHKPRCGKHGKVNILGLHEGGAGPILKLPAMISFDFIGLTFVVPLLCWICRLACDRGKIAREFDHWKSRSIRVEYYPPRKWRQAHLSIHVPQRTPPAPEERRTVQVEVPQGCAAGTVIAFTTPEGQQMHVSTPEAVPAGGRIVAGY